MTEEENPSKKIKEAYIPLTTIPTRNKKPEERDIQKTKSVKSSGDER